MTCKDLYRYEERIQRYLCCNEPPILVEYRKEMRTRIASQAESEREAHLGAGFEAKDKRRKENAICKERKAGT